MTTPSQKTPPTASAAEMPPRHSLTARIVPLVPIFLSFAAAFIARSVCPAPHAMHTSGQHGHTETPEETTGLPAGTIAPDFELLEAHDISGTKKISLAQMHKESPVLIVFYAGYSCPRCVAHLRDIAAMRQAFDNAGIQIVAISHDLPQTTRDAIKQFDEDIPLPLLSDPGDTVSAHYLTGTWGSYTHGIYIVGTDGRIAFSVVGEHPFLDYNALLTEAGKAK
jgi:peroxiredoxin